MGNLIENILAKNAGAAEVFPNQIVEAAVNAVMLHDIGTPGIQRPFQELGGTLAPDVTCIVVPDHFVPAPTIVAADNLKLTREFAKSHEGIFYYEQGRGGICHQIMVEKGHVKPGEIIGAPDAHATAYGAIGALGVAFGVTDVAIAMAKGRLWFKVPETIKITLNGRLQQGVTAKDIILFLLKEFEDQSLIYKSIELTGSVISELSMDSRQCICNMAYEIGVKCCLIPPDEKTFAYLDAIGDFAYEPVYPDQDATYWKEVSYDVSNLTPMVAMPHHPSHVVPVSAVKDVRIDQAFLGSCTNGRIEDLRQSARILKNQVIHPNVRMIVTPASQQIYKQAIAEGLIDIFIDAGALVTNPGCGVCLGGHLGLIGKGETCISTSNRNFKGRMGSVEGSIYLASPATVTASAVKGYITEEERPGGVI